MATSSSVEIEQAIDCVEEDQLTPEEKRDIKEWVKNGKSIEILVTGKTGVGKSSLLNYLLGKEIFEVGESKKEHCTDNIKMETSKRNGIQIKVWDSPGLQDGTGNDTVYLESLKKKCSDVDLMLYCITMEETRSDLHIHESAIRKINELQRWKNTVFVLTFANNYVITLESKGKTEDQVKIAFKARIAEWENMIKEVLTELKVEKKIVDNIQVVPAGHPMDADLPGYRFWLSYVWSKCLLSMQKSAQAALIQMETNDGFLPENKATDGFAQVPPEERKIVFTRRVKAAIGIAAGGAGAAGFAVGAAIGGTIGALAIGIPSFGPAAGVGLGIGAAVGGAIGAGVATGVGALIALYRKRKMERDNQ